MAKRTSLAGNVTKAGGAEKAAKVAKAITGKQTPASQPVEGVECETVSYHLPVDLIDLYRDLAERRHRVDQAEKRRIRAMRKEATRLGLERPEMPQQARQSASAVMREAMEAYADTVRKEIAELEG